jgi:hypothetical protein
MGVARRPSTGSKHSFSSTSGAQAREYSYLHGIYPGAHTAERVHFPQNRSFQLIQYQQSSHLKSEIEFFILLSTHS